MSDGSYLEYAKITLHQFISAGDAGRSLLTDEIPEPRVARVLDVGCGAGLQLLQFAEKKGSICFGIDIGEEVVDVGNRIFLERGLAGKGIFMRSIGEELPFADKSFDVVVCRVALPYMDNRRALSEISRVLCPRGRLFLKVHGPMFYLAMISRRLKTLDVKQLAYPLICLTGGTINLLGGKHPTGRFWRGKEVYQTRRSLEKVLDKNGLRIIKELPDTDNETPSFLIEKL